VIRTPETKTHNLARRFAAASFVLGLLIRSLAPRMRQRLLVNTSTAQAQSKCAPIGCGWPTSNSVTEINEATGAVVRVLDAPSYDISNPVALGWCSDHLWVVDSKGDELTEINAKSGSLIRVVNSPSDGLDSPSAIAVGGSHVWGHQQRGLADSRRFHRELGDRTHASNASLVRVISDQKDKISYPDTVITLGSHVWVGNSLGNSLTELRSTNGSLVRIINIKGTRTTMGVAALNDAPQSLLVTGSNFLVETETRCAN